MIINKILSDYTARILWVTLLLILASNYQETTYITAMSVIGWFMPFAAIFIYFISFKSSAKKHKFIA